MLTIASVKRAARRVLAGTSCVLLAACGAKHAEQPSAAKATTTTHATQVENNGSISVSDDGARWTFSVHPQAGEFSVCVSAKRSVSGGPSTDILNPPGRPAACFRPNDDPVSASVASALPDTATHAKLVVELGGANVARIAVVLSPSGRATVTQVGIHSFFVLYPATTDLQRVTSFDRHGRVTAIAECLHDVCP